MEPNRRQFLHFSLLAAPAVALADTLNIATPENTTPKELEAARAAAEKSLVIEPYVPGHLDQRDHALYDTLRAQPGAEIPEYIPLFHDPVGMHAIGSWNLKSYADTNMVRGCQLPPPQAFAAERILFLFGPDMHPEDRAHILKYWAWEFILADKVVSRAPLALLPVSGSVATMFEPAKTKYHAGRRNELKVEPPYCVQLRKPVHVPSLCQFQVVLMGKPLTTKGELSLHAVLDGIGTFGVQF